MTVLCVHAGTEGQSEKLAAFAAGFMEGRGRPATMMPLDRADQPVPAGAEAIILLASVHMGRLPGRLGDWMTAHAEALSARRTAFVTLSLAVQESGPKGRGAIENLTRGFLADAGLAPDRLIHMAGAVRDSRLGWIKRRALHGILKRKGVAMPASGHIEFTDWRMFADFLAAFHADLQGESMA